MVELLRSLHCVSVYSFIAQAVKQYRYCLLIMLGIDRLVYSNLENLEDNAQ